MNDVGVCVHTEEQQQKTIYGETTSFYVYLQEQKQKKKRKKKDYTTDTFLLFERRNILLFAMYVHTTAALFALVIWKHYTSFTKRVYTNIHWGFVYLLVNSYFIYMYLCSVVNVVIYIVAGILQGTQNVTRKWKLAFYFHFQKAN